MTDNSQESPPHWLRRLIRPGGDGTGHSNEVEHRLTWLESDSDQSREQQRKHEKRIARLERMAIVFITILHALAHDKLPEWAKGLSGLAKMLVT